MHTTSPENRSIANDGLFARVDKATLSRGTIRPIDNNIATIWASPEGGVVPSQEYTSDGSMRGFPYNLTLFEPSLIPPDDVTIPLTFIESNPDCPPEDIRYLPPEFCVGIVTGDYFYDTGHVRRNGVWTVITDEQILHQSILNALHSEELDGGQVALHGYSVYELGKVLSQLYCENLLAVSFKAGDREALTNVLPHSDYLISFKELLLSELG